MNYLLALDQGTSSSRSIVFDEAGHIVAIAQRELTQIYPQPGWVEHDPMEIWTSQVETAREVLAKANFLGHVMTETPVSYRPLPAAPAGAGADSTLADAYRVFAHPEFGPTVLPEPAKSPQVV